MIKDDECVETLKGLGLTLLQARTYLALVTCGKANVKTIAKVSNVARQDTYRVMLALQKLGLAEKIIANPTMYKVTPLKEGLPILIRKRTEETAKLQKKTKSIINDFNNSKTKTVIQEENTQFRITSESTLLFKLQKTLSKKTQTNLDIAVPIRPLRAALFLHPNYLNWAKKDVKIRLITQKPEEKSTTRKLQASTKNRSVEIKYFNVSPNFGLAIFDNKEVTLSVSKTGGLPSLWSNNPNVVKLARNYFEEMWNKT